MKKYLWSIVLLWSVLLLVSCGKPKEDLTKESTQSEENTEQTVLNIGAVRPFEKSPEGSTLVFDSLTRLDDLYQPLPGIIYK